MPRLPSLLVNNLNDDQRALFETLTGGKRSIGRSLNEFLGPDGAMRGPFNAMLHHPAAGKVVQRLGELLRFEGTLNDAQREVAILTVGRHWRAQYEWWAHARIAEGVGVARDLIQAIYDQGRLPGDASDLIAIHTFVRELMETQQVSDAAYAVAHAELGDEGIVELVILAGYYGVISGILNTFEVPLPAGETPPFDK